MHCSVEDPQSSDSKSPTISTFRPGALLLRGVSCHEASPSDVTQLFVSSEGTHGIIYQFKRYIFRGQSIQTRQLKITSLAHPAVLSSNDHSSNIGTATRTSAKPSGSNFALGVLRRY